jgi:hypothetical protein
MMVIMDFLGSDASRGFAFYRFLEYVCYERFYQQTVHEVFFRSSDKHSDDESEGGAQQGTSWKGMHTLLQ